MGYENEGQEGVRGTISEAVVVHTARGDDRRSGPMPGGWIQTFTGRRFYPLDPDPGQIDIRDIAHALSQICRYGGHCRFFYSVAEHSVLLSRAVPPEYAMEALLHDAAEAYLGDMCRPMKRHPDMEPYRRALVLCEKAIAERFLVPVQLSPVVADADTRIIEDERRVLFPESNPNEWWPDGVVEPLGISPADFVRPASDFLYCYSGLGGVL